MSAARYWHTLRYLKARQIAARLWWQVRRPSPDVRPAPPLRHPVRAWEPFEWREPSLTAPATATFLNVTASIADAGAWQDSRRSHLWLYNLHYFDDLTSRAAAERRDWHALLLARWIAENPPASGVGWASYPTALRIGNWIKWSLAPFGTGAPAVMFDSLAAQARWLSRRLEFHLMANHLWANAKALLMAGVCFEGAEADAWRHRGLEILEAELDEQMLADGGHFERSPMYHAILLEDVLDLIQLDGVFAGVLPQPFVRRLHAAATRMLRWLRVMTHPDGDLSFFNDAAFGVAAPYGALEAYARATGVGVDESPLRPVEWLRESGYVRLTNARASVFCDVAPIGPDYQPAHAHADTLSFELSVDGRRVIVNGGTSTYARDAERARQRSTAAHSTVEVDGRNSSDVWGAFRVARRARAFAVDAGTSPGDSWATGAHDGYRSRGRGAIHRRTWRLRDSDLTIVDELEGEYTTAIARFILHPAVSAGSAPTVRFESPACDVSRQPASWHPRFGETQETEALAVALTGGEASTYVRWSCQDAC